MASYPKRCDDCHFPIILSDDTSDGHWIALDPETNSFHRCPARASDGLSRRRGSVIGGRDTYHGNSWNSGWGDFHLGEPRSFPTKCWECGELVLAHTNGFGDFVLLKLPAGRPWTVHPCYLRRGLERYSLQKLISKRQIERVDPKTTKQELGPNVVLVLERFPHRGDKRLDAIDVWENGAVKRIELDYWRSSPQPNTAMWIVYSDPPILEVLPIDWEHEPRAEAGIASICTSKFIYGVGVNGTRASVSGLILAVEMCSGCIVVDFTRWCFRMDLVGEKPRLIWVKSNDRTLTPIIARKWYANQRPGATVEFSGIWRQYGTLMCLVADIRRP